MKTLNQLNKILIAVEDSDYSTLATAYGFELARKVNAQVALLHVNEIPVTGTPYITDSLVNETSVLMPEVMFAQEESSKKLLNTIAEKYEQDITIYTFHKIGSPQEEIVATAEEWDADMIILGTHGRTGFDHFISGSVAEKVVRRAKCPVLIIPNEKEKNH